MANGEDIQPGSGDFAGWDKSIDDQLNKGVTVPDAVRDAEDNEKVEARIATGLMLGIVGLGLAYEWHKHRHKE